MFTLVPLGRHLSDISEAKCNQPSLAQSSSHAQNKAHKALSNVHPKRFFLRRNGCCITHSDKSGARPSLWQRRSLPRPPIQKPTAGKLRPFQVHRAGTKGKSVHNVNKVSCANERLLLTNCAEHFLLFFLQLQMINKIDFPRIW